MHPAYIAEAVKVLAHMPCAMSWVCVYLFRIFLTAVTIGRGTVLVTGMIEGWVTIE